MNQPSEADHAVNFEPLTDSSSEIFDAQVEAHSLTISEIQRRTFNAMPKDRRLYIAFQLERSLSDEAAQQVLNLELQHI
jgi:hypothetical protein